jgi:hypothetical protein
MGKKYCKNEKNILILHEFTYGVNFVPHFKQNNASLGKILPQFMHLIFSSDSISL